MYSLYPPWQRQWYPFDSPKLLVSLPRNEVTGSGGSYCEIEIALRLHIPVPITIKYGGFVTTLQRVDSLEVVIGKRKHMDEHDRTGWDRVLADKEASVIFLRKDA
jgi:hypothetical protein